MSSFHKNVALAAHDHSPRLSAKINLATISKEYYLNLSIEGRESARSLGANVTLSVEQAKALRDALLEAYPVEALKAPAPVASSGTGTAFKVGDKVRVAATRHGASQKDCEGVITSFRETGDLPIWVDFADSPKVAPVRHNTYAARDLVLVTPRETTGRFIVSLLEGSTYKPGVKPVVHTSHALAAAEAERLAKAHGGTFHVLRATFEATREKPVIPPVKTAIL